MSNFYTGKTFDSYTEKEKDNEDVLIEEIDKIIGELVYDKDHLRKAYNYYNGTYDEDQFKYLEDLYGLGTPTELNFIPLVRNHIEALIGEHLMDDPQPAISCKDSETLSGINKEKQLMIHKQEIDRLTQQFNSTIFAFLRGESENLNTATEEKLQKLKEEADRDFISEFEMAAFFALESFMQSKVTDLKQKLKLLFIDLLTVGQCYFSIELLRKGEMPRVTVENPFDVFLTKDATENRVEKSVQAVVRHWMTRQQIIADYGRYLDDDALDSLDTMFNTGNNTGVYYIRNSSGGIMADVGITTTGGTTKRRDSQYRDANLIPVYKVQWLSPNKIKTETGHDYRMDRYSGIRVGEDVYVKVGRDEDVIRTKEAPLSCTLLLGGVVFDDRSEDPYSLINITAPLQDKYNLLHFYRDNLIGSSGTVGTWVDVSSLPVFLGGRPEERLAKFVSYKKAGIAPIDTSQEGRENLNTIYNTYDETVPVNAIQGIQLAIQATEATVSNITGIFGARIGQMEERDAASNVKVGIKQSAIITKQYHQLMNRVTNDLLISALNACKLSYKEGYTGSVILGDKLQKIFTIDPNNFSFTDYDVHIPDAGEYSESIETIKALAMSLVQSNAVDVDVVLDLVTSKSLTQAKEKVSKSVKEKMAVNSQIEEAAQTIQQLEEQLKQVQNELNKTAADNEQMRKKADDLSQRKLQLDYEVAKEKNKITKDYNDKRVELEEERTELEKLQLLDNNPYNNTVSRV